MCLPVTNLAKHEQAATFVTFAAHQIGVGFNFRKMVFSFAVHGLEIVEGFFFESGRYARKINFALDALPVHFGLALLLFALSGLFVGNAGAFRATLPALRGVFFA